jgi:hypothetical protein
MSARLHSGDMQILHHLRDSLIPPASGENDKTGMLVHKPGGAEHGRWIFDYDVTSDDDDEAGFLFGRHAFVPGEYVSVLDPSGITHTFLIRSVASLNSPKTVSSDRCAAI